MSLISDSTRINFKVKSDLTVNSGGFDEDRYLIRSYALQVEEGEEAEEAGEGEKA